MPRDTVLHKAAYKCDTKNFPQIFQESNLPIDSPGAQGRTPLHRAISANGGRSMVEMLLKQFNANPNSEDQNGATPLHWAAIMNRRQCAEILVQYGADVNKTNRSGATPLHVAATNGSVDMIQYLKRNPIVDVSIRDKKGLTAYDIAKNLYRQSKAAGKDHKQSMKLLRQGETGEGRCGIPCF